MAAAANTDQCCDTREDGSACPNPAKFIYQVVAGRREPLCGVHARRFQGSRGLRPIPSRQGADL